MDKVGFTGSRAGMTLQQKEQVKKLLQMARRLSHGDCIGADAEAHQLAKEIGLDKSQIYPCYLISQRAFCDGEVVASPKHPLTRNHDIVDNVDWMIATPKEFKMVLRSGTWATIRYAVKVGKPIVVILPDGSLRCKGIDIKV